MIVAKDDSEDILLEWSTYTTIETMLNIALIEDKSVWLRRLIDLKYEHEGQTMIDDLREYTPVIGYHRIPMNVKESMEATRIRIERDNFQEERWKKDC